MALFDFLSRPVGGYSTSKPMYTEGVSEVIPGEQTPNLGGITWGSLLASLAQKSNDPEEQAFGSLLGRRYQPLKPRNLISMQDKQQDDAADIGTIANLIAAMFM